MYKNVKHTFSIVGLVLFIALALAIPNCADAQQGVVPAPQQPTIEELLTIPGPVSMFMVWEYVVSEFGDPNVASPVVVFEAGIDEVGIEQPIFHIQAIIGAEGGRAPNIIHFDVPLDAFSSGGARSNDGLFEFIWFCRNTDIDPEVGCPITNAEFVFAYDRDERALLGWPERISQ